ncbi:MAG: LysR substrate-binding domain-containing protein, partial [Pikeienuella sp.]
NVTPAAISHQVKALERELRCELVHRYHRGVELTETGVYLLVSVQRGFEGINEALEQLRAQHGRSTVTIRSTAAVSALWLTPRLAQFWRSYGHISVAQIVSDSDRNVQDCDLSIHYGDLAGESGACRAIFRDRIMALGSPRFARLHRIETIADLAAAPLIHLEAPESGWTDWRGWLRSLGYAGALRTGHRVNNYMIALQAAEDDMGAVLGWEGLTGQHLASGRLVKLLPDAVPSPQDFYVKLHNQSSDRAQLLYGWLA